MSPPGRPARTTAASASASGRAPAAGDAFRRGVPIGDEDSRRSTTTSGTPRLLVVERTAQLACLLAIRAKAFRGAAGLLFHAARDAAGAQRPPFVDRRRSQSLSPACRPSPFAAASSVDGDTGGCGHRPTGDRYASKSIRSLSRSVAPPLHPLEIGSLANRLSWQVKAIAEPQRECATIIARVAALPMRRSGGSTGSTDIRSSLGGAPLSGARMPRPGSHLRSLTGTRHACHALAGIARPLRVSR